MLHISHHTGGLARAACACAKVAIRYGSGAAVERTRDHQTMWKTIGGLSLLCAVFISLLISLAIVGLKA